MQQDLIFPETFVAVWPLILWLDVSRYIIAAGTVAVVLAILAGPLAKRRIQPRNATWRDVRREIGYSLMTAVLFSLVGFSVHVGSQAGIFQVYGGELPSASVLVFEFLAIVLLHDTYFYWMHRMIHRPLAFRAVHRLHHKSRTPTPWAAYSFALPESILEAAIMPLAGLLFPFHEFTAIMFVNHMIIRNVIGHAGVELFPGWWLDVPVLRWITTTTHHDLHHQHGGYNFGLYFTWWDRWMGTEHPQYRERFDAAIRAEPAV